MKIRKLQLKNIGVFDDETIEFQPCPAKDKAEIHIFTGQNGSGKTTILQALVGAFGIEGEFNFNLRNSFEKRIRKPSPGSPLFLAEIHFEEKTKSYNLISRITEQPFYSVPIIERTPPLSNFSRLFLSKNAIEIPLSFCTFAYSGYRRVKNEDINLFDKIEENPLRQALDFIKDENSKFTINQWLGRNLSKRALALEESNKEVEKFTESIENLEKVISDVVGYEIRFKLKTDLSLVLIKNNEELDFDVLPDGLKSLISWIGDLLMRLDSLKWENDTPIFEREILLFLDEIEVHLHPAWQRKVLPVVQELFKNSQIFVSTHSPFVVNSVDDAWVYKLELDGGKARVAEIVESENSNSITQVLREIFGIEQWFGLEVQNNFERFKELKNKIISNGADEAVEKEFLEKAKILADEPNDQLKQIIKKDLEELSEIKKKSYTL